MALKSRARLWLLQRLGGPSRAAALLQPSHLKRLLVLRPDHLGDLLLSTPALARLRSLLPQTDITLAVGPWNEEAARHIPAVDAVRTIPYPWFDRQPKRGLLQPYGLLVAQARALRSEAYDATLVLRHDFWWGALLAVRAGIPQRIGYLTPETAPLLTTAVSLPGLAHETPQTLHLVEAAFGTPENAVPEPRLSFALSDAEQRFAREWLAAHAPARPLVALHPGAGAAVKLWPPPRFAALVDWLTREQGASVVLTGSEAERGLVTGIVAATHATPTTLVGATLGELAAVLACCDLAVGVDSGVLHLASAVDTPTVRLYGPVDPARFGPWGEPGRHVVGQSELRCVPCNRLDFAAEELPFHPCVRAIEPEQVQRAIREVLGRVPVNSGP